MLRSGAMSFGLGLLAGLLAGVFGSVLLILWYTVPRLERLLIFRPVRDVFKNPSNLGLPYDQCFIDTPDGCRLSAWHMRPKHVVGSVIYFHGNGGNLGILNEILALLYRYGLEVLAVDYRGYGWSTGVPSEEGLYTDATSSVEYFYANFQRPGVPVVYWGRSLGGCVAAHVAGRIPPNGVILETAFPSKASLMEHFPQFRRFQFFSRSKLETARYLEGHQFPVLLLHGEKDRTVPLKQGQLLYTQLTGPKQFWSIKDAGHIDIHMVDTERYMQRVLAFVRDVTPEMIH